MLDTWALYLSNTEDKSKFEAQAESLGMEDLNWAEIIFKCWVVHDGHACPTASVSMVHTWAFLSEPLS